VAAPDPEMAAMNIEARVATMARPPRTRPMVASAMERMRSEMPPRARMSPARMKNGTATRAYELLPSKKVCGTICRGIPLMTKMMSAASPTARPTGTPRSKRTKKLPKRTQPMLTPSARSRRCPPPGAAE
jgi:hypothetical protein